MARPRQYDLDTVIDRAMHVFWAKGYGASSLDDICGATRLNRSSLYNAFGDKHALFLKALDRYGDYAAAIFTDALLRPIPMREALEKLLSEMIDQIMAGPGRVGCFIGNCAAEVAPHDHAAAASVQRNLERVEDSIRLGFVRAKERGEISDDTDINALARFLWSSVQGLRLLGKTSTDRKALEDIASVTLRAITESASQQ